MPTLPFLLLLLLLASQDPALASRTAGGGATASAAPVLPVAVLRSGARVECLPATAAGARVFETPYGRYDAAADPVVEVMDAAREAAHLRLVRESDRRAWLERVSERGLLSELLAGAEIALQSESPEDDAAYLAELHRWGARLDPVPAAVPREQRVEWLWSRLQRSAPVEAALLAGRVAAEIPGPSAPSRRRVGLVDLRRALRSGEPSLRRAAALVAERQGERDLLLPLVEASLGDDAAPVRSACAGALAGLDRERALGRWTLALWRGSEVEQRNRAAEYLGEFGDASTVPVLIYALVADGTRPPGAYAIFGRQISIVGDFDVEVAQAAAIADPVVKVLTEGVALEVRILSTQVTRSVLSSLRRLTGADPGPAPGDWLRWWEASESRESR